MKKCLILLVMSGFLFCCNTRKKSHKNYPFSLMLESTYSNQDIIPSFIELLTIERKNHIDSISRINSGISLLDSINNNLDSIKYLKVENSIMNYFQPNKGENTSLFGWTIFSEPLLKRLSTYDTLFPKDLCWKTYNSYYKTNENVIVKCILCNTKRRT